jgi:hypothetical protein
MESHKLGLKLFAKEGSTLGRGEVVPVFHSWIQTRAIEGHQLIDVADYAHVKHGPGTVLVAHEANLYTDEGQGRLGLLYQRKHPAPGGFGGRLRQAFRTTLEAARLLEAGTKLRFDTREWSLRIYDRLLAPNTEATFAAVKPELGAAVSQLYPGADVKLDHRPSEYGIFEVSITTDRAPSVEELSNRLPGAALV